MPSVLILDEAPLRVLWLEAVLQGMDWQCLRGDTQEKALPLADITLLALHLQHGNGFESAMALRRQGHRRIWLLSDLPAQTDDLWARSLGLEGVLRVPATTENFRSLLRASLEVRHEAPCA